MQELLNKWANANFADFKGLSINASVPIKEELANQLIADFLAQSAAGTPTIKSSPSPTSQAVPMQAVLRLIKKLEVRASLPGVITIHLDIRA